MRDFCKLNISIWQSKRFKRLDDAGKLFYLYCLSSPRGNAAGCFVNDIGYMMVDLKWSEANVSRTIKSVCATGLISWDPQESIIFINRWFDFNAPTNPKHAIKVFSDTLSIPYSHLKLKTLLGLYNCLEERQWTLPDKIKADFQNLIDTLSKDPVMKKIITETETETETETTDYLSSAKKTKTENLPVLVDSGFPALWEIFPSQRKGSRDKALTAWQNALMRSTPELILDGVRRYAQSREVREGFAKGFAAWLNDDRWTHDYSEKLQPKSKGYDPNEALDLALNDPTYAHLRNGNGHPDANVSALPDARSSKGRADDC